MNSLDVVSFQRSAIDMFADQTPSMLLRSNGKLREIPIVWIRIGPEYFCQGKRTWPYLPFEVVLVVRHLRPVAALTTYDVTSRFLFHALVWIETIYILERQPATIRNEISKRILRQLLRIVEVASPVRRLHHLVAHIRRTCTRLNVVSHNKYIFLKINRQGAGARLLCR